MTIGTMFNGFIATSLSVEAVSTPRRSFFFVSVDQIRIVRALDLAVGGKLDQSVESLANLQVPLDDVAGPRLVQQPRYLAALTPRASDGFSYFIVDVVGGDG